MFSGFSLTGVTLTKLNESISNGAQYVTPQKYFSHPSFSYLLFPNLTHKTKTGTANRWEITNSNPLDQSNSLAHQKQGAVSKNNLTVFIRLFQVAEVAVHFF
jgi:hypothetical protein